MTDKTEAQPEALRLADLIATSRHQDISEAGHLLRALYAEIQQLKAQNANLRDALTDIASGEITRSHCVGPHCTEELGVATADELSSRAAGALDWDDRVAQPSPDVGIPRSAQLSARQAAPDEAIRDALVRARDWFESQAKVVSKGCGSPWNLMQLRDERDAADAALSAAPPPPEREPRCWCETCRTNTLSDMRFIVCPDCGNKRCPKATHHDNACTNSNAPGQPGSSWEHVKPHGATND